MKKNLAPFYSRLNFPCGNYHNFNNINPTETFRPGIIHAESQEFICIIFRLHFNCKFIYDIHIK